MSDFGDGKIVKLRKDRRCAWCGDMMLKGDTAYHFKGMWQGDWQDWRMHLACEHAYNIGDGLADGFTLYSQERAI